MFRVKKPHNSHCERLLNGCDSTIIREPGTALYLSKLKKDMDGVLDIRPIHHNMWRLTKKREFKRQRENGKYMFYE